MIIITNYLIIYIIITFIAFLPGRLLYILRCCLSIIVVNVRNGDWGQDYFMNIINNECTIINDYFMGT